MEQFNFEGNKDWQEYIKRFDVATPDALLRLKKKWYSQNIEVYLVCFVINLFHTMFQFRVLRGEMFLNRNTRVCFLNFNQ